MRIAYFLQLNMGVNTGVYKKIISQAQVWVDLGHDVGFFVSTKEEAIESDLILKISSFKVSVSRYHRGILPPPFDGRISSLSKLLNEMEKWSPDIVYTRQDLYLPPISKLVRKFRVVTEVNTNDLGELKGSSRLFLGYYTVTRDILLKGSRGHIYVSGEISQEKHYKKFNKPNIILGNGIDLNDIEVLPKSSNVNPRLVFIGHSGYSWHGVDKLLRLAEMRKDWHFDLIGISPEDLEKLPSNVTAHGVMKKQDYIEIFKKADCAIGSLALHRNGMNEASPLKVREYLAYGIPTIIGYTDTDFLPDSPYLLNIGNMEDNIEQNINRIDEFVKRVNGIRIPRSYSNHLDYRVKEVKRLDFFGKVLYGMHKEQDYK